jgi:hypothetical protein
LIKIKTDLDRIPVNTKSKVRWDDGVYYEPFLIGFCGKTYIGYKFETIIGDKSKFHYLYGKKAKEFLLHEADNSGFKYKWWSPVTTKKEIIDFFNEFDGTDKLFQTFIDFKVPIFKIELTSTKYRYGKPAKNVCFLNPNLKNLKFFKVFDSFQAFQEIEMFIGGVLADADRDIIEIEEKYRQQQRGMGKWSFRNPDPPKRKQK